MPIQSIAPMMNPQGGGAADGGGQVYSEAICEQTAEEGQIQSLDPRQICQRLLIRFIPI